MEQDVWAMIRAAVAAHEVEVVPEAGRSRAAVLILLVPHPEEPHVVLTVRTHEVEHHKGEISFPGGMADPSDRDLIHTALREAHEEVGIDPGHVEVVGPMSHTISRAGFHVTPFVGVLDRFPYPFRPSAIEVAEVLQVPLSHLFDPGTLRREVVQRDGAAYEMFTYPWQGHEIWGLTGGVLHSFLHEVAVQMGFPH